MEDYENEGLTLPLIMTVALVPVFVILAMLACGLLVLFLGLGIVPLG